MAEHVWTAYTLSHACVCRDSPGITASMMLTSVTRGRVKTEAPVRMDTAPTNAPALTDTPDSTARYTNESTGIYTFIEIYLNSFYSYINICIFYLFLHSGVYIFLFYKHYI